MMVNWKAVLWLDPTVSVTWGVHFPYFSVLALQYTMVYLQLVNAACIINTTQYDPILWS